MFLNITHDLHPCRRCHMHLWVPDLAFSSTPVDSLVCISRELSLRDHAELHWSNRVDDDDPSIHPHTKRSVCHFHKSVTFTTLRRQHSATTATKLGSVCAAFTRRKESLLAPTWCRHDATDQPWFRAG